MPPLDQLTARLEAICANIQDSINIIESFMERDREFTFNYERAVLQLDELDVGATERVTGRMDEILTEYRKPLTNEKVQRKLQKQIMNKNETKIKKEALQQKRFKQRIATYPFQ